MSAEALEETSPLALRYADRLALGNPSLPPGVEPGPDELWADGQIRSEAEVIGTALSRYGTIGLQTRRRTVERLVADDGVTYGVSRPDRPARPWQLDPLPLVLGADAWASLERGLEQRARLLDALFADLNGPQRVIRSRIIPAEVIAGHVGFLPPVHNIPTTGRRALPMIATDLVRSADGGWAVVSDRTQAPSGAGYAMANRRIISRALESVHRNTSLRRLRGWFDLFQMALHEAAPAGTSDLPRVVLLTPGPGSETAFDQSLLSTLLGHPMAQSGDLVIHEGRLMLRTMGRLAPVDVLLRRVDAAWSDSLDLLSESRLGVPGLVAAARRGTVSVVNHLRSGVLENAGLLPHQDALARALLGEDLILQTPHTWWCGDPASRHHVLGNLERLVVKPIHRGPGTTTAHGWTLDAEQLASLRSRIEAQPWEWTAQEPLTLSTAPVVTSHGLEPRNVTLRTFGVAVGEDYHFLPGGLARVGASAEDFQVANATGAGSKDVWVLDAEDSEPARIDFDALRRSRAVAADAQLPGLTPRSASNLYWMGRYAERAEVGARLLMIVDNLVEDHHRRAGTPGHAAMGAMLAAVTEVTTVRPGFTGPDAEARLADPLPHLGRLLVDQDQPGTVADSAQRATASAAEVREMLALDTSSVLARMNRTLADARADGGDIPVQATSARVLDSLLALAGLSAESLVRDTTWAFLEAGRRMERAQTVVRLLRNTIALTRSPVVEGQVVEAVLRVGDSIITYRRRMSAGVGSSRPATAALTLLLTDATNPRSVLYQLDRLGQALALAPADGVSDLLDDLRDRVRDLDLDQLSQGLRLDLVEELIALEGLLRRLSDAIEATHFVELAPQSSFAVAELAGAPA